MNHFCHICGKLDEVVVVINRQAEIEALAEKVFIGYIVALGPEKTSPSDECLASWSFTATEAWIAERDRRREARASNKATDNMDLRAEIAGKDAQIKALEGLISGAIQHSWTPDDYEKFWLAAGKERL